MRARWIDNVKVLTWMRLGAAALLLFMFYWIFSDLELTMTVTAFIPLVYFFNMNLYLTKKVTLLILPILVNLSLWIPCYRSYIFLRIVLYAERLKMIVVIFITLILTPFAAVAGEGAASGVGLALLSSMGIFCFNQTMIIRFKGEYKNFYHAEFKPEQEIKPFIRTMVIVFYISTFLMITAENFLQNNLVLNYARVESKEFEYKELKVRQRGEITNTNKLIYPVGNRTKLSPDEKMFLMRIDSLDDNGIDLFIFDTNSMNNIKRLQSPIAVDGKSSYGDYTFTQDGKYVIVGNDLQTEEKIKFQVIDIRTEEPDNRFRDSKGLLETMPNNTAKVHFIQFNPAGNYFVVVNDRVEIWDYENGNLLHVDRIKGDPQDLTWVSDRKLLALYRENDFQAKRVNLVFYQCEIREDGSINTMKKEKISAEIQRTSKNINTFDMQLRSNFNGNYMATFINKDYFVFASNAVNIWDVNQEKKVFSIIRGNEIRDIQFHPDGKRLVVYEEQRNKTGKITLWDIATETKQREIIVPPLSWNGDLKLISNGKKAIVIGESVHFITLE